MVSYILRKVCSVPCRLCFNTCSLCRDAVTSNHVVRGQQQCQHLGSILCLLGGWSHDNYRKTPALPNKVTSSAACAPAAPNCGISCKPMQHFHASSLQQLKMLAFQLCQTSMPHSAEPFSHVGTPAACCCVPSAPVCRKMIVVEGVYANSGDVAPLQALYELKEAFKYRLCVEESQAFGVLGQTGKGACEAAGLQPGQVEVVVSSMGTSLASVGGFCVGHHEVCDHQRLCGQGYCFSASLPPYLAIAAHEALNILGTSRGQQLAAQVRSMAAALRKQLSDTPGLVIPGNSSSSSSSHSPVIHLQLSPELLSAAGSRKAADALLQAIADRLLDRHGLLVSVPRYSSLDGKLPPASIKFYVHVGLTGDKVSKVAVAIRESARHVLGPLLASV
eukprot:GHUV01031109.1.p1 GENE.GHUV01031109.1~~GHUV01031109.1.p1  ORF type:complete len:390 (+),score=78.17 GHUV01031109.1:33-1202(+)